MSSNPVSTVLNVGNVLLDNEEIYHVSYMLSYHPSPCIITNLGGSEDYHPPLFTNELERPQYSMCVPQVTQ